MLNVGLYDEKFQFCFKIQLKNEKLEAFTSKTNFMFKIKTIELSNVYRMTIHLIIVLNKHLILLLIVTSLLTYPELRWR